jgi:hypothetical protein
MMGFTNPSHHGKLHVIFTFIFTWYWLTHHSIVGHVFYKLVLQAYSSGQAARSVLDYSPLHATPLHACFHLNYSYHILTASAQPNETETTVIASAVDSIIIHTSPNVISQWINTTKTITLQLFLASLQGPSRPMLCSVVLTLSSLTLSTPEKVHHQTDTS